MGRRYKEDCRSSGGQEAKENGINKGCLEPSSGFCKADDEDEEVL